MTASRLTALDGLRGVAALIVLLHHALLLVPGLAAPYYGHEVGGGAIGLLVSTPLHAFWAGTEAVYLFFILSGLVLAFAAQSNSFAWSSYFPSRIARLYLPVIGAVLLGAVVIALTPDAGAGDSLWVQSRPADYGLAGMLQDITLLGGVSNAITPLWSLQWEVLFSLLLPCYLYVARRMPAVAQIAVCVALATFGSAMGVGTLMYLPMFGIGVALAALWEPISARFARMPRRVAIPASAFATVAALLLATSYWTVRPLLPAAVATWVTLPIVLVGIMLAIVLAANVPLLATALSSGRSPSSG